MNSFAGFWDSLGSDKFFLILGSVFFLTHVIFLIYRCVLLVRNQERKKEEEGVSVVITCSNKAELLKENLPAYLEQDYPSYEVIVVDECSEDETQDVLADFQKVYPHLKTTRIFPGTKFRRTKKIAIHIGVLAATHDILLFAEIDGKPESKHWVRTMQSYFDRNTAVVLGYANYPEMKGNAVRRYFHFLRFWETLFMVNGGACVMGNAYNMGYRKKYYIEKRGFSGNTQEFIGYESEMVKVLASEGAVKVVKDKDARVVIADDGWKSWTDDNSYYYTTKRRWPGNALALSHADFVIEMLLYVLLFYFVIFNVWHKYFVIPVLLTFLTDVIVTNIGLKHLGLKKLFLTSLTVNVFGFVYKGYYSICSIFTGKKWR